jgi:hypothetical protein
LAALVKKLESYIIKELMRIEDYKYLDDYSINYIIGLSNERNYIKNIDSIRLKDIVVNNVNKLREHELFDITFVVEHKHRIYTFETSNYYLYKGEFQWTEDIYENIDTLLSNFRFLLENYDNFISINDDEDEEDESIDSVAYGLGFEIDDDGHWIPVEDDLMNYDEYDSFRDNLKYDNSLYIYNCSEENGRFYWED